MNTDQRTWKDNLFRHEAILLVVLIGWNGFFPARLAVNFGTYDNSCDILRHSCEIGLLALGNDAHHPDGGH